MGAYDTTVWNYLISKIGNEYGVSGMMGNMFAESGIDPTNLQDSYEPILGFNDEEYTNAVDSGSYNNFVNDSAGYGLCQWTYHTRKQKLLSLKNEYGCSIGDITLQLDYLMYELENDYPSVLEVLKECNDIKTASDYVLINFEQPADQSESVQQLRLSYSENFYNTFSGGIVPPLPQGGLLDMILQTSYNVNQLNENEKIFLNTLEIGSKVRIKYSFNKNKKTFGTNSYGQRIKVDTLYYNIKSVTSKGFIILQHDNSKELKKINPKYIKE